MADWKSAVKNLRKALRTPGTPTNGNTKAPKTGQRLAAPAPPAKRKTNRPQRIPGTVAAKSIPDPNPVAGTVARPAPPPSVMPPASPPEPAKPAPLPSVLRARRNQDLIRAEFFRMPARWTNVGQRTQTNAALPSARAADVVIGIDFGTAFTKAAVGFLDRIYPVTWDGVTSSPERYLLPSEYTVLPDGTVVLGQHPQAGPDDVRKDLKLPFIHPGVSRASVTTAAVFLALVLQYVRAWLFEHHGSKLGYAQIRWQLNIGAPCDGLEDDRLRVAYRRLAGAAWRLSLEPASSMVSLARYLVDDWTDAPLPDLTDLTVCPEFVAQIAGYVQSAQRIPGLHALADVGGGTVDVVTFIVHRVDADDTFPFLVPSVKWLGTQMLLQNRLEGAQGIDDACIPDALSPAMDAAAFAAQTGLSASAVEERDRILFNAVKIAVAGVFGLTRRQRYRLSDAWVNGLRTFITGGGARVAGYCDAITQGGLTRAKRIDLMPLPIHPKLADFNGGSDDYQRISVACGLAQDSWSLGKIIPAKEIEDDAALPGQYVERPDRDELYAR